MSFEDILVIQKSVNPQCLKKPTKSAFIYDWGAEGVIVLILYYGAGQKDATKTKR